jgi:phosphoserine aminotransferase
MQDIFFTQGQSKLYPTVPDHLASALRENVMSMSHRGEAFQKIFRHATDGLREFLEIPDGYRIFFLGSGTEAMERIIENCVERLSFHFVNGAFSEKFHTTAVSLKKEAVKLEALTAQSFSAPLPEGTELVCFTQNETSTGIAVPVEVIHAAREQNPEALIAVDIVSSAPYVKLDFAQVDAAFFSVQKGFGLPAGLGVLIVSPRALEKADALRGKGVNVSWYHSFGELSRYADKNQTPETPNVLNVYLLGKVIEDMKKIGIENIRRLTDARADSLYQYFSARNPQFSSSISDPAFRSRTTAAFRVEGGSAEIIRMFKEQGIIVGSGYGKQKEGHIRISNFPAHTDADFKALFLALDRYS